ncbi:sensor domain-containing diguanylate cyclase [Candidatus Formimonas warabiya]|uniref:GGDEF domain-containing protein n=1 Tax=Formimonas warabiya TaxID=1761012 RepID=A0A3G1KTY4_FORW1|nr:diguanylate cyclase [Candidatus Formimonas warabiya]ATW25906.1 hypothetical protein DCMF_14995 [Candidatus Formimonas warabiya]
MKVGPISKNKILIRSLIIIVLLFTCTFILIEKIVYEKMKADAIKQILLLKEITNIRISDVFVQTKLIAEQLETNNEIHEYLREVRTRKDIWSHPLYPRVLKTLRNIQAANPTIYLAWVSNEAANFCLDSSEIITDTSFAANIRPWYQPAVASREAAFSQPYYEYTTNTLAISCVKALREEGTIKGFVSVDISLDSLPPLMQNFVIGKNGKNYLLTSTGTTVFTSENPKNKELISLTNLLPYLGPLKAKEKEYEEIELNHREYYLTYQVLDINHWGIIQLIDKKEVLEPFYKTMRVILYIFLISCLLSIAILLMNIYELRIVQQKLKKEAVTDYLTGIHNRKFFFESSQNAFESAREQQRSLSLFMIDIDKFKEINDTKGHAVGDMILKKVAEEFNQAIRKDDILCRLGGDEFAVLLMDIQEEMALVIAHRILESVSQLQIDAEKGPFRFSVSIGIAFLARTDKNFEALLNRADAALYRAKNAGRNTVSF